MYLLFEIFCRYFCDNTVKPGTPQNQRVAKISITLSLMGPQVHLGFHWSRVDSSRFFCLGYTLGPKLKVGFRSATCIQHQSRISHYSGNLIAHEPSLKNSSLKYQILLKWTNFVRSNEKKYIVGSGHVIIIRSIGFIAQLPGVKFLFCHKV